ncbi:MAG: two pore domain potassium channel family protein [Candidatus Dormibacteraeota bacterium]|nr:two pore domain potassium channel family protein [Candidatus Dormibacteraeota bacterium]
MAGIEIRDRSGTSSSSGWLDRGVYRYGLVLLLLAATFTFVMVAPTGGWAQLLNALLFSAAILTLLYRARVGRPLVAAALGMLVVAMGCAVAAQFSGRTVEGVADLAIAGLLVLVPVAIVDELRRHLTVTLQSVTAALCVYLVFGMFFARVASAVAEISGSPYFTDRSGADGSQYLYFSFITLATVGYGDFVPALRLGRALAVLEGLLGQLYLVTVVALVVGSLVSRRAKS